MKLSVSEFVLLTFLLFGGLAMIAGPYWSSVERGYAVTHFSVLSPGSGASIESIKESIAGVSSSLRRAQWCMSIGALGALFVVISLAGLWYNLRKQIQITKGISGPPNNTLFMATISICITAFLAHIVYANNTTNLIAANIDSEIAYGDIPTVDNYDPYIEATNPISENIFDHNLTESEAIDTKQLAIERLKSNPNDRHSMYFLAVSQYRLGELSEARNSYQWLLTNSPERADEWTFQIEMIDTYLRHEQEAQHAPPAGRGEAPRP